MIPIIVSAIARKHYVKIKFVNNRGDTVTEDLFTEPIGGWTKLNFDGDDCVYAAFLNTMVYKNVDVFRRMAELYIDAALDVPDAQRIQLLNAMRILDPTFTPPWVNVKCRWQMRMVEDVIDHSFDVIERCRNVHRLEKYVTVLQRIVLAAQQQQ